MTMTEGGTELAVPQVACDLGIACDRTAIASYLLMPKCDHSRVPSRFACDGCAVELADRPTGSCMECGLEFEPALDGFNVAVLG